MTIRDLNLASFKIKNPPLSDEMCYKAIPYVFLPKNRIFWKMTGQKEPNIREKGATPEIRFLQ